MYFYIHVNILRIHMATYLQRPRETKHEARDSSRHDFTVSILIIPILYKMRTIDLCKVFRIQCYFSFAQSPLCNFFFCMALYQHLHISAVCECNCLPDLAHSGNAIKH